MADVGTYNSWQSWENVLSLIKLELGNDLNKIEFSDDRIIEIISEHVLPLFSSYDGWHKYYKMTEDHIITKDPYLTYQFKDFPYRIIKVKNIITGMTLANMALYYDQTFSGGDITDYLVKMNYGDINKIAQSTDTWKFIQPNQIIMYKAVNSFKSLENIVELDVVHESPVTIDATLYDHFCDLCIAQIMIFIGRMRSKFKDFNTPFGQVQLNAEEMIQEGKQLKQETIQKLEKIPPEQYVWFL